MNTTESIPLPFRGHWCRTSDYLGIEKGLLSITNYYLLFFYISTQLKCYVSNGYLSYFKFDEIKIQILTYSKNPQNLCNNCTVIQVQASGLSLSFQLILFCYPLFSVLIAFPLEVGNGLLIMPPPEN